MLDSYYKNLGSVQLPSPSCGRQIYMQEIDSSNPSLPDELSDYLPFVVNTLKAVGVSLGKVFMTIDEKVVKAGGTQRKPFPHVDGHFYPSLGRWGGGGWNHTCNGVPFQRMPVIIASSTGGTALWEGRFDTYPKEDGDLSHAELGKASCIASPSQAYVLSPDCVHESPIMVKDTERTFVRLALPVSSF